MTYKTGTARLMLAAARAGLMASPALATELQ